MYLRLTNFSTRTRPWSQDIVIARFILRRRCTMCVRGPVWHMHALSNVADIPRIHIRILICFKVKLEAYRRCGLWGHLLRIKPDHASVPGPVPRQPHSAAAKISIREAQETLWENGTFKACQMNSLCNMQQSLITRRNKTITKHTTRMQTQHLHSITPHSIWNLHPFITGQVGYP
ncbi:hypothetical protein BDZ97DRAFT_359823 [Flammula alnicola]|nr:hypothetical protein BDZ97DRAFT_359823 [Flammula alnicola]